jgi:predicted nuclease of restriction endonuclease-like RecB superfamily
MLTGKMIRVRYARDRLIPLYLDPANPEALALAERLIALFAESIGQPRGQIEAEAEEAFGDLPQPQIYQGLAKLLEDRCDFETLPGHPPEALREVVFTAATAHRAKVREEPGAHFQREVVLDEVATQLGLDQAAVETGLFADLKSEQRLVRFADVTPTRLLERYNVALAQGVLLRSSHVEVTIRGESPARYRQLFRQVKFHRLICEAQPNGPGEFLLRLDGPLSLFSATQKYGLALALFLPTVLLCRDFELNADVLWGPERRPKKLVVSPRDGLESHQVETGMFVPPEIGMFVELFRQKITDWDIGDETDVVLLGDRFWVPDFQLTHRATGNVVLLDLFGFWRRSGVERHLTMLRAHADRPFLVALSNQLKVDEGELEALPEHVLRFRNMPLPEEVARRAAEIARQGDKETRRQGDKETRRQGD